MRLSKFRLQNFRSHADSTLDIGDARLVVIRGPIHSGKSSILQGLSLLVTPSTDSLDARGAGFISKIRHDQNKAILTGDIVGTQHTIQRTVTLNTNTSGRVEKSVCMDDEEWHPAPFDRLIDSNRPALSVLLNVDHFLNRLSEDGQKSLLSSLVLPSHHDFPADKIAAVDSAIGQGTIDFSGDPLAAIEKAYSALYKERTAVNRTIKEFGLPEPVDIPEGVTSQSLQASLEAAREERRIIQREKDAAISKASDGNSARAALATKIAGLDVKVREESARLDALKPKILDEATKARHEKSLTQKANLQTIRQHRGMNAGALQSIEGQIRKLEALRLDAGSAGAACPTCDRPIDMAKLDSILEELRANAASTRQKDIACVRQEQEIGDVEGAERALAVHTEALNDKQAIESKLAEANKQLTKARKGLEKSAPAEDAGAAFAERLSAADKKVEDLESKIRPIIGMEERAKDSERRCIQLEKLKTKSTALDELVSYFDKDGIKAKLLAANIGGFTEKFNETLKAWDYKCTFSIEPYEFRVTGDTMRDTPVNELSGSEKLMFSIALQCAVAQITGIGLVATDRMDTFPPSERSKANACLYNLLQGDALDQVVLAVTDDSTAVPDIPKSVFFMVEKGTVRKMPVTAPVPA